MCQDYQEQEERMYVLQVVMREMLLDLSELDFGATRKIDEVELWVVHDRLSQQGIFVLSEILTLEDCGRSPEAVSGCVHCRVVASCMSNTIDIIFFISFSLSICSIIYYKNEASAWISLGISVVRVSCRRWNLRVVSSIPPFFYAVSYI